MQNVLTHRHLYVLTIMFSDHCVSHLPQKFRVAGELRNHPFQRPHFQKRNQYREVKCLHRSLSWLELAWRLKLKSSYSLPGGLSNSPCSEFMLNEVTDLYFSYFNIQVRIF